VTVPASTLVQTNHDAIIELFDLDLTPVGTPTVLRFCNHSQAGANVVWRGNTYTAIALECTGFEYNGRGQLPIPQLTLANTDGAITNIILYYGDMICAQITRHRTFARYLDGSVTADPTQAFEDDIYFVDRKVSEDKVKIVFSLASALDLEDLELPGRVMTCNACTWVYRSSQCTYAGGAVATAFDVPTWDLTQDVCGKSLNSCKLRFGQYAVLPFGAFPGLDNINL
jgi:lambda family phage minor tail protein L